MKKRLMVGFLISMFVVTLGFAMAYKPDFLSNDVIPSNGHAKVFIPNNAVEVSPGVFSLGPAKDDKGRNVEGFLYVHSKNKVRPSKIVKGDCYSFLSRGAKWKNLESYIVDTTNNVGLNDTFIRNNIAKNIQKFEDVSTDILGVEADGVVNASKLGTLNNKNEVLFQNLGATNTIAYTIVWGVFSGHPKNRVLVEWDMVFNENFEWSSSEEGVDGKMDFENIATHELGHALGLGHPRDTCTEETMYAYAGFGETKKRDLNAGDIKGISSLYK